jgi:hypothetical protein
METRIFPSFVQMNSSSLFLGVINGSDVGALGQRLEDLLDGAEPAVLFPDQRAAGQLGDCDGGDLLAQIVKPGDPPDDVAAESVCDFVADASRVLRVFS